LGESGKMRRYIERGRGMGDIPPREIFALFSTELIVAKETRRRNVT
jgi:hypothetical protein